jgi:hypothetical protein
MQTTEIVETTHLSLLSLFMLTNRSALLVIDHPLPSSFSGPSADSSGLRNRPLRSPEPLSVGVFWVRLGKGSSLTRIMGEPTA